MIIRQIDVGPLVMNIMRLSKQGSLAFVLSDGMSATIQALWAPFISVGTNKLHLT